MEIPLILMGKLSPSKTFSMQGPGVPEPPSGLPLGEGRAIDSLSQSDAAAICAGLSKRHYLAGRVLYAQDWSSCAELERYLWVEVAGLAAREKWTVCVGQETLRSLAGLAVAEIADPVRYGKEAARVAWFGRKLKMEEHKIWPIWERTWRSRYQAVYSVLERWAGVAASHVAFKQRDED